MYLIAWSTPNQGINIWQLVDGEDAMQKFVYDLTISGIEVEDVYVFNLENQI